ncbi:transcriptional regulator [Devosia insulae DS-56]|uniref:Transcriptional regulator n=1 Tax=Devosia insulae DS-56 TaxID=1116389 RepID=A0A1E5XQP7_9HYPH|nr:Rrf2 family transcriptional regulator [Devosia insulae]OEO30931.1 transcriptional regulator [Devosia insulae DS-56]
MNKDTRLSGVLHVLLHLGQVSVPLTSEKLAATMGTNPAIFRRTMAGLRKAGHVHSGKGHGGGWLLAQPLTEITLLDVYQALGRPALFAFGNRSANPACKVEQAVNEALGETLAQAEALFVQRFGAITLDRLMPSHASALAVHGHPHV